MPCSGWAMCRPGGYGDVCASWNRERRALCLLPLVDTWRRDLTSEKFSAGCPLVAAAADTEAASEQLSQVLRRAFDGWLEPLSESLAELGVSPERSGNLAVVVIAALERALILGPDQARPDSD